MRLPERALTPACSMTLALALAGCGGPQGGSPTATPPAPEGATSTIVLTSDVVWEPLNPARGDASPMAATLWGDRNGPGPTGFLFGPADGFESPPHIHNVTYRGVVIRGLVHNADQAADEMWMSSGSFWTQPRGDAHITAARGTDTLAYIEIDTGPYLVHPVADAFESGEEPINIDASNIVWADASDSDRSASGAASARVANLWGGPLGEEPRGMFVAIASGATAQLRGHASALRAVVIQGLPTHRAASQADATALAPGSYVRSTQETVEFSCGSAEGCALYVRFEGGLEVVAVPSGA